MFAGEELCEDDGVKSRERGATVRDQASEIRHQGSGIRHQGRDLEEVLQVAAAVDNSHDFHLINQSFIGVRMGLVKNQIGTFDQHSGGPADIGTADTEAGVFDQHFGLRLDCIENAFGCRRIIETDVGVDFDKVFTGLRSPEEFSWHGPGLLRYRPDGGEPLGVFCRNLPGLLDRWLCLHPKAGADGGGLLGATRV